MDLAAVVVGALAGFAVGPWLTTLAWRTARKDVDHPAGAHCPRCGAPIGRRDRLPIVSWLLLRGRCRAGAERIPAWYPLTELAATVLLGAIGARFGLSWELPGFLVVGAGFVVLTVTDIQQRLLPNRVVYPTGLVAGPLLAAAALLLDEPMRIAGAAGAGAACFAVFFVLHFIRPDGMAFGDVRLSFLVGMSVGWIAPSLVPVALLAAFLTSSVIGIAYGMATGKGLKATIPFGPFLTIGALAVILTSTAFRSPWSFA